MFALKVEYGNYFLMFSFMKVAIRFLEVFFLANFDLKDLLESSDRSKFLGLIKSKYFK